MCFCVSPIREIDCFQWHVSVYIRLCALHAQTCHTNHTFIKSHQSRLTNNTKQLTAIDTKTDTQMMHVLQTKVCANWTSTLYPKPRLFMAINIGADEIFVFSTSYARMSGHGAEMILVSLKHWKTFYISMIEKYSSPNDPTGAPTILFIFWNIEPHNMCAHLLINFVSVSIQD